MADRHDNDGRAGAGPREHSSDTGDFEAVVLPASLLPGAHTSAIPLQLAAEDLRLRTIHGGDELPADFATRTLLASVRSAPAALADLPAQLRAAAARAPITVVDPETRGQSHRSLVMLQAPASSAAARYRMLRYRVLFPDHPQRLLITSALSDGDATLCAVNLAMALSECGRARVLLVDGNFRDPSLAKTLGIKPPACFHQQVLEHKHDSERAWTVAPVFSPWLHALAIDSASFTPSNVFDGPALENALLLLSSAGYDYIVVAGPPVLGQADVNVLQDCVDATLISARARHSALRALRSAVEQLGQDKLRGVALIDV